MRAANATQLQYAYNSLFFDVFTPNYPKVCLELYLQKLIQLLDELQVTVHTTYTGYECVSCVGPTCIYGLALIY